MPAPCELGSFVDGVELCAAGPVPLPLFVLAPPPVVEPFFDSPVVAWLAAGPPALELPPALLPD
ncbi:hypothetical protein [Bradyrhizobium cenepequi]